MIEELTSVELEMMWREVAIAYLRILLDKLMSSRSPPQ
jgi:hypothetical protein